MEEPPLDATAVGSTGGWIVSVGTLENLSDYIDNRATVDERFAEKFLMSDMIDQHVHSSLLDKFPFIARLQELAAEY